MLVILSQATKPGIRTCNQIQYLGTVLYLYNILRQYGIFGVGDILLERLCDAVSDKVFRGRRPTQNFFSQYVAFQGGTLEFDKGRRSYKMVLASFHKKRLNAHHLSATAGFVNCHRQKCCYCWVFIWRKETKPATVTNREIMRSDAELAELPIVNVLDRLEGVVTPE